MISQIIDSFLNWTLAVDWVPSIKDWVGISKDIIVALAAIATATVAIRGIDTWKNQIKAKIYFDVAHDILSATYKIREEFARVRNPMKYSSEIQNALIAANLDVKGNEYNSKKFEGPVYEGKILLPDDFNDFVISFRKLKNKLLYGIRMYVNSFDPQYHTIQKKMDEICGIIFSVEDPSVDPFAKEVDDTIDDLKKYLTPYIRLDTKKYLSRGSNEKNPSCVEEKLDEVTLKEW